ncbi:hypothetical protein niasHS_003341 [Heterodera schachtii]|uniref:GPI inositol-deacylase n=1 Tax=Heterodera schachtii TaxID=97005 RepID=A0ABD2KG77_HETSC
MWRRFFYLDIGLKHEAYSLLLYAEGLYKAQRYGESGELDGFPLLFVPGNAGSGRQVRSLGSLLQNKTERLGTQFHFDTFALDFNGEMTALNFDYIESQAQFLADSVGHILSLYSSHKQPKIVLIGHSMGGIVIQKMLTDNADRWSKHIAFVLTFATPFSQPPVLIEKRFLRFWDSMNGDRRLPISAKNGGSAAAALPPPAIVSVSGGLLDEFIDEGWTLSRAVSVHAHSAAIDRIWAEADHLCIVWCNEIVRQTSRFLFDYAASPTHFLEKFHDFAHLHYHSLGLRLRPITSESVALTDLNVSLCTPKCPSQSVHQKFDLLANSVGNRRLLLLAIAKLTDRDNSVPKFDLLTASKCGQNPQSVGGTRFLDTDHLFAVANLSNCDGRAKVLVAPNTNLWVFNESAVFLPEIHLSFGDFIWGNNPRNQLHFSMEMNPLAIVPIHFPRNEKEFGIFRVEIWRTNCRETAEGAVHRRIVFSVDGVRRRFDKFGGADSNSPASLLIYPVLNRQSLAEMGGTHYQLMLIDTAQCAECFLRFSFDLRFSLIRLFRQSQHLLPASCVFASVVVHFYVSLAAGSRRFVNLFVLPLLLLAAIAFCGTDVLLLLLLFDSVALFFFHLLLFTLLPFFSAVHRPFCSFTSSLPLSVLFFLLFALSTTFTNNTFPLAVFGLFLNIAALHRRFVSTGNAIAFSSAFILLLLPPKTHKPWE